MKSYDFAVAILLAAIVCAGCGDEKTKPVKATAGGGHTGHQHWCNVCGFIIEDGNCGCDDKTAKKCEKCGFQEGSPACCVKELVALHSAEQGHFAVCGKCGELELKGKCGCDEKDAKVCPKCGKHEGSLSCRQHCGTKKDGGLDKAPPPVEAPAKGSASGD